MDPIIFLELLYVIPNQLSHWVRPNKKELEPLVLLNNPKNIGHIINNIHLTKTPNYILEPIPGFEHILNKFLTHKYKKDEFIRLTIDCAKNTKSTEYIKKILNDIHSAKSYTEFIANPDQLIINVMLSRRSELIGFGYGLSARIVSILAHNPNPDVASYIKFDEKLISKFDYVDKNIISKATNDKIFDELVNNPALIDWASFNRSSNPKAIDYLETHPDKIDIRSLSANPSALKIITSIFEQGPKYKKWKEFVKSVCRNPNPEVAKLLIEYNKKYPKTFNLDGLSGISADFAIDWLEANPNKICLDYLCANTNPRVIPLILERVHKWKELDCEECPWEIMSSNPIIFSSPDFEFIKRVWELTMDNTNKTIEKLTNLFRYF